LIDLDGVKAVAQQAAIDAGHAVVRHWDSYQTDVRDKGAADVVSAADLASDRIISAAIRATFPGHRILSEEDAQTGAFDYSGPLWIVDPIDGTANYVRGHPYFGISVAFAVDGVVMVGCVHAPALAETFVATRDGGATLNGASIKTSSPNGLARSVVSTGFPHDKSDIEKPLRRIRTLLQCCQDVRRSASPVLDIAYVAMGRLDAHAETLFPWDVAAAGLIAKEAGALRGHLEAAPANTPPDLFGVEVVFSAPSIFRELMAQLT
jgi:myo-inositol-1(or 4)-monophosphatase